MYPSPVGELTLASDGMNLIGLWITTSDGLKQKYFAASLPKEAKETVVNSDIPVFLCIRRWLDDYFTGRKPDVSGLPLAPAGSAFRQSVWQILRTIPYGEVTTYGAIAKRLAKQTGKAGAQAVGGAVGHNPISIIIPCHRVVGVDGSLTGYAAGLAVKQKLLEIEGVERFAV
jgi:methylated-DNA-[protein]-cysteine S-methyltransferase